MRRATVVLMAAVLGVAGVGYGQTARVEGAGVDEIARAGDPAAAMLAYRNLPADDHAAGEAAYVRRMGELGLPDMVEAEAREVVKSRPDDAGAWAVIAEDEARRGEMMGALSAVASASNAATVSDALVEQTAGRLLAWADAHDAALTPAGREAAGRVRSRMKGKEGFESAYAAGRQVYGAGTATAGAQQPGNVGQLDTGALSTQPYAPAAANPAAAELAQQYVYTAPVYTTPVYTYPSYDYSAYCPPVDYGYPYADYGFAPFYGGGLVVVNGFSGLGRGFRGFRGGFHGGGFHGGFHSGGFHGGGFGGGFHGGGFGGGFHGGGFHGGFGGGFHGGGFHGGGFGGGMHGGGFGGGGHR